MTKEALDGASPGERYGVSLVNGFYGKGTWAAWCLLVVSAIIDKLFTVEQDTADKKAHICGLDINLVGSFVYPFIAAVDLLLHMPRFFNNNAIRDVHIARIDASLVVLREGMVFGFFLMLACAFSTRKSKHKSRGLVVYFSGTCVLLFVIINRVFDIGYCQFGWQSYVDGWVMMPYHRLFDNPQSALAAKYPAFARAFRKGNNGQEGPPFWSIGLFVHTNLIAEAICKAFVLRVDMLFSLIYACRRVVLSVKQAKRAQLQRHTRDLSKRIEPHEDTGHAIDAPEIGESSRGAPGGQSDIELDDMSRHRDLEAQLPRQPKNRSSRLRPPEIDESEGPPRPQTLASMLLIDGLEYAQVFSPTYLYLSIKFIDKVRPIFVSGPPIDWVALGVSNIPPTGTALANPVLNYVVRGTVLWQALRALVDIVLTFAMMISHMAWMVPIAEAKFKDLDQLGAFIMAGVLPLVYSIGSALCERFDIVEKIKNRWHARGVERGIADLSRNF